MNYFFLLVVFLCLCFVDGGGKKKKHHVTIYVPEHIKHEHHTKIIFIHKHDKKDHHHHHKDVHKKPKEHKPHASPEHGKKKDVGKKETHHHIIHHYHPKKKEAVGSSIGHEGGQHYVSLQDNNAPYQNQENYHNHENFHGYHHQYSNSKNNDGYLQPYNRYTYQPPIDTSFKSQHIQISKSNPSHNAPNKQIVVTSAYKVEEKIPDDHTTNMYAAFRPSHGLYNNFPPSNGAQTYSNEKEDYTLPPADDFDVASKEYDYYKQNYGGEKVSNKYSEQFMDPASIARFTSALHHGTLELDENKYQPKYSNELEEYIRDSYGENDNEDEDDSDY